MVSKSVLGVVAALTFSGAALAQVPFFNVDVGANVTFPAPAATFSGASTQAGTWNARSAAVASSPLIDINGTLTAINASIAGANVDYQFNNTGTLANSDDEKLLDDLQDLGAAPLGTSQWTIGPMPAGAYKVTFYSWAPDNRTYVTDIVLTGGANGTMQCGNSAGFTGYVLGETHVGSDYLGPVARRGLERPVSQALAVALREARGEWDVLDFLDLEEDAPFVTALQEAFEGPQWRVEVRPRYVCPYERFEPGETFETFLRRTGRRDNYLRRRKWLEKQPGFAISCTRAPGELAGPLAEFFRLHAMRWQGDGGSQGIKGQGVEAFHRDALALMAERGRARLYTMHVTGKAVASVYGLRHRERFWYFQSGYDPAWRDKSVGLVLVGETFRDALAEGCREYDFLRGTEAYKADWVSRQRRTVAVRVYARGGPGAWLTRQEEAGKRIRNAVKAMLPTGWVEKVRRMRRQGARL